MLEWVKILLKPYPSIYKKISYLFHFKDNYWRPNLIKDLNIVLRVFSKEIKNISFIQIGSNDGISGDPLHSYIISDNWQGVLIEPIPFLFEQLTFNYSGCKNLQFRNCAVGVISGTTEIFSINEEKRESLPSWYFQLASFDRNMLLRHGIPEVESLITKKTVDVETFDQIMKSTQLPNLNLIHIDTEGYDFEILKTINLNQYKPEIIILEYRHLSIANFKESLKLLKKYNYKVFRNDYDIISIRYDFYNSRLRTVI